MSQKLAVIYIPGLGDAKATAQHVAIDAWKNLGIEPYVYQMQWADGKPYKPKIETLLALAKQLRSEGKLVCLVGASAGGSIVINAYAQQPGLFHGVACICGKVRNANNVQPLTYQRNSAFQESMQRTEDSIKSLSENQRKRILSLHPLYDPVVPIRDTRVPGAKMRTMAIVGHFLGIAYGLTISSFGIVQFFKKLPAQDVSIRHDGAGAADRAVIQAVSETAGWGGDA
jgi:pimeloyl-ACP methyl ester carboxylesterase